MLLELHEKVTISSLLNNSESWNLNKGEEQEVERIEIQALKDLFDLPLQSPHTNSSDCILIWNTLHKTKNRPKATIISTQDSKKGRQPMDKENPRNYLRTEYRMGETN